MYKINNDLICEVPHFYQLIVMEVIQVVLWSGKIDHFNEERKDRT